MSFLEDEVTQSTMLQPPPTTAGDQPVQQNAGDQPATSAHKVEKQPRRVANVDQGTRSHGTCSAPTARPAVTLKELFKYKVLSAYWLEIVVAFGAMCLAILIVLIACFAALPQLKPNCTVTANTGHWSPWSVCPCGGNFTTTRHYSYDSDCYNETESRSCPRRPCCDGSGQTFNGSSACLAFDHRLMSWSKARHAAGSDHVSNLASIHSDDELHFIWDLWKNDSAVKEFNRFWIGFRCFKAGYCEWSDGSDFDFVIGHEKIVNGTMDVLCAYMDFKANDWNFIDCELLLPFLKRTVNLLVRTNCSRDLDWCYGVHDKAEWGKAHDLVTIHSAQELMFIKSFADIRQHPNKLFWIGLQCSGDLDQTCVWRDGSPMTFSNWSTNAQAFGGTFCVLMDHDGGWQPSDCQDKHEYIKESEPHCDKIGHNYWTTWTECQCGIQLGQQRERHRETKVNGTKKKSLCPSYVSFQTQKEKCIEKQCDQCPIDETFEFCYKIPKIPKSMYAMMQQPQEEFSLWTMDKDLVAIGSKEENDYIMKVLKQEEIVQGLVLIGLICERNQQLDSCAWNVTGQRLSFNKFSPGQPRVINADHRCVAIDVKTEQWQSVDCNTEYKYVLEHRPACDKFVNYSRVAYEPVSECDETGYRKEVIKDHFRCPLIDKDRIGRCKRNCTPDYESGTEYCYKVVTEKKSFASLTAQEYHGSSAVLAVMLDKKHAKFINERVVPRALENTSKKKKLWLGFTCFGKEDCYWQYNDARFDPTAATFPFKSDIEIERTGSTCGILDWKSDANQSALRVTKCKAEREYILEFAPGCNKFHHFANIEYDCDHQFVSPCGSTVCTPTPTEIQKNCPHYVHFSGSSCCVGQTNDDVFGCYAVAKFEGEGFRGPQLDEQANEIANLADPLSKKTVRFWRKSLITMNSGLYLTSTKCMKQSESFCEHHMSLTLPDRMERFLKASLTINTTERRFVIYNSHTNSLELLVDDSTLVTGYITQYAKHLPTDQFGMSRCRREIEEPQQDIHCPAHGRCCRGKTAEHVYACYEVVISPHMTYDQCKGLNSNLADLGKRLAEDAVLDRDRAVTVATVKLLQQIIGNDTGRYWTNLRCKVEETGHADCWKHGMVVIYGNSLPYKSDTITHKCNNEGGKCCAMVYDSSLRGLNTQDCDSTENINGYILQNAKYVVANGKLHIIDCYQDIIGVPETEEVCPTKNESCTSIYTNALYFL